MFLLAIKRTHYFVCTAKIIGSELSKNPERMSTEKDALNWTLLAWQPAYPYKRRVTVTINKPNCYSK